MNAMSVADRLGVSFGRYDAEGARGHREQIEAIYQDSYVEAIGSGNPFHSVEAFMSRFDSYSSLPDFDLVMAFHDDEPIGQTWGWPLHRTSGWWNGLESEPEARFTDEDGGRTFALSEIMVTRPWTGKGIAHALHDALLSARHERRATLLVEPDNVVARRAYERWGWLEVGRLRPGWEGAPILDVMVMAYRRHLSEVRADRRRATFVDGPARVARPLLRDRDGDARRSHI